MKPVVPRGDYESMAPAQIEQAIHELEEERVAYDRQFREEKARAHAVLDRKNTEARQDRVFGLLSPEERQAIMASRVIAPPSIEAKET
jgi:hypothetical protein